MIQNYAPLRHPKIAARAVSEGSSCDLWFVLADTPKPLSYGMLPSLRHLQLLAKYSLRSVILEDLGRHTALKLDQATMCMCWPLVNNLAQ